MRITSEYSHETFAEVDKAPVCGNRVSSNAISSVSMSYAVRDWRPHVANPHVDEPLPRAARRGTGKRMRGGDTRQLVSSVLTSADP